LVTRDDLPVSALADAYDLGSWESIEMLPGDKSDHYRLIAGSGEYAITRSHRSRTSADMRFEHELVRHLLQVHLPVSELGFVTQRLPLRKGASFVSSLDIAHGRGAAHGESAAGLTLLLTLLHRVN
jgi:Ser/Thr protein kinase RdoA (MazF antagonist)